MLRREHWQLFFLALLLGTLTCVTADARGKRRYVEPEPSPSPTVIESPAPIDQSRQKVSFTPVEYYSTKEERVIIAKAGKLANQVFQSECFKEFISKRKMIQTEGRSSPEAAAHLQSLAGVVPVVMYYRRMGFLGTSAVAFREPPSKTINLNRAHFWSGLPLCEWASTMGHESIGHSLGEYGHDYRWSASRDFSVPYSINAAFEACCKEPE
jgi:hypothetical protein